MHKGVPFSAACMCLLFLLLTPVSPQCRTGTVDECNRIAEHLPGLDYAERGIDITSLHYTTYRTMDLLEWRTTGGGCTFCENPLLEEKPLYKLPLAVVDWQANISCQQKVQRYVPQSVISVAEMMTELSVKNDWKTELDVAVNSSPNAQLILAGSDDYFTSFIEEKSSQDEYIFLLHHASCSYYKFGIDKDKSVSEIFEENVKALPRNYNYNSKRKYHRLIRNYGTHFIKEIDLGVTVRFLTALPACKVHLEGFTVSKISKCLEMEVGKMISFDGVTKDPDFQKCKKILENSTNFWISEEQVRDIRGGKIHSFSSSGFTFNTEGWLASAKSHPGLLSFSLDPLHTLVGQNDTRREGLRQAVSTYVRNKALCRNCTHSCPPGVQPSAWGSCSCECPNNNFTNAMCCSQQRGLAKLRVTVGSAVGLWGDVITASDGYVRVLFRDRVMCTPIVWNNNNPKWNAKFDFGVIQVREDSSELQLEVWDQDFGWNNDLLGRCTRVLRPWDTINHACYLNHGHLNYKYHLVCGPHLGGPFCSDYILSWVKKN
ncbi:hypothetical protein lerEdw1_021046 [Lerista edwardsae]|nr:hypothetical protein lerEdw1_021046 [Lerista edwardsae]